MPDGRSIYRIQMKDAFTGESIITAGGTVYVSAAGDPAKATIYDNNSTGAAKTNPLTPSRGFIEFATADTIESVDLFILAPGGQFVVRKGIKPSGPGEILVDTNAVDQCFIIPFSTDDAAAATEISTGFVIPAKAAVKPSPMVDVITIDATEDIDVGTLSSASGDADGFMDAVSVAVAGLVKASLLAAGDTMGALLSVLDSANSGDDAPEIDVTSQSKQITYTLSAGSDTAEGYIYLPYFLAQ